MEKVFLDCGIIKNIIHRKNPDKTQAFYKSLQSKKIFSITNPFFIYSPLLLLELLGINMDSLISLSRLEAEFERLLEQEKRVDKYNLIALFFDRLHMIFYKEQLLTKNVIKQKIKYELAYRDGWGHSLLIHIFMNGVNTNNIRDLHRSLVFEMIQTMDFKKYFSDNDLLNFDIYQFKTYAQMHTELKTNYPFYRSISNIYKRSKPKDTKYTLRAGDEIGDSELIHFSLFGHSDNNEFFPVKIFTTEKLETWKNRFELALIFIKFMNEEIIPRYNEVNNSTMATMELKPGTIYQVDQNTGLILDKYIDISLLS
ncbi:MAG: hypothetical protein WC635_01890 [Bacteriovorax sp.]|jgi:hypothetical protein